MDESQELDLGKLESEAQFTRLRTFELHPLRHNSHAHTQKTLQLIR